MTRLFLIRHGITRWNKEGRYCGSKDIGLSRLGRTQASSLHERLKTTKFDKVYSSAKKRALETCRIIFDVSDASKVKELGEIDFGVLEGLRHEEIIKRYPGVYRKWLKNPFEVSIPGAEPIDIFKKRVEGAMRKIVCSNSGKTVAVICHGGVISIFLNSISKKGNFWQSIPSAASITIVEYKKGKPKIKKFNDTVHLG